MIFDPSKLNLDLDNLDNENKQDNNSSNTQTNSSNKSTNQNQNKQQNKENISEDNKQNQIQENKKEEILKSSKLEEKRNIEEKKQEIKEIKDSVEKKDNKKEEKDKEQKEKIIFDINLDSPETLISILIEKKYDFFTIEPSEDKVKINFFSQKILRETKYIKYPTYTKLLLKIKNLAKLKIEETDKSQESSQEIILNKKAYKILVKTVPSSFWEKIFLKAVETNKKIKKQAKKTSPTTILGFLWALLFVALVLWWAFISFVVMNAKTVEDVKFFYRLWINLNDINNFIESTITVIFSIIIFLELVALIIFLFKFFLTKKEFKKKRIVRWILSFFILLITLVTGTTWMIIDKKIRNLPNWQELAYWNVQILDNDILNKPDEFNKEVALLTDTANLIWPINIKFDITNLANSEKKKWIKIKKFLWNINWKKVKETLEPFFIHKFDKKWTYKIDLTIEEKDIHWDTVEKKVENIPSIEIWHIVKIDEQTLDNGWKIVKFDASDLKELWKVNWYFINKNEKKLKPVFSWYKFDPAKVIFEDTIIWLEIVKDNNKNHNLDKIFVIQANNQNEIKWEIDAQKDPLNDLKYSFKVKNLKSNFGNWFIESFKWIIDKSKVKILKADLTNPEKSSTFNYTFKKYWKHLIQLELKDSLWNKKIIEKEINVKKDIRLKEPLTFIYNWEKLDKPNLQYNKITHEYFIKNIKAPTTLTINAKNIESENILDYLKKIEWDIDWDWEPDKEWKVLEYKIPKQWSYKINVFYTFQNKRVKSMLTKLKETIYIDSELKDYVLDLRIKKPRNYVPVIVSFDASNSYVKWKNIVKFEYDYWDWTPPDVRDAINPWHKYLKPGNYTVKLTVYTDDWKSYSIKKALILKPRPQKAEITTSLLKAPIYTSIDFSSEKSSWEISNYFWDFGDWETSTEANPSHMYKKPGKYKVKLILDFKNKNSLTAEKEIEITDDE